jgi:hypothetical protein
MSTHAEDSDRERVRLIASDLPLQIAELAASA